MNRILPALVVLIASLTSAFAQDRPEFHVTRAETPPTVDGSLEDDIWQNDPLTLTEWVSYDPLYGSKAPQRTDVRVAYDERNLYFAFHCYDTEPEKIRTTISRRDNIWNDDWVGLSLDSSNSGQISYHMMVNPSGIQLDMLNSSAFREQTEPDWIWESAGRVTADGYVVEIRLPLQSIRFNGGSDVKMGILFWRRVSRMGVSWSWPDIPPGQWVFNRHAWLVFDQIDQPTIFELLPSTTFGINQTRATPDQWNDASRKGDFGLSTKYGITSSITLDATINPDFSQVESDAFQVQVNQRFPVFFSEKRPFFMEGMGIFNLAGASGDSNMQSAIHTRHIINPTYGGKITGNAGPVTFGLLNAADESPVPITGLMSSDKKKLFTIGRAQYGLGASNYVGSIITDTQYGARRNRVIGADGLLRFKGAHQFNAAFLSSQTRTGAETEQEGVAAQAYYSFSTRKVAMSTQLEHYSRDFTMDTAFYNRTGFSGGWLYGEMNYYPREGSWLRRVTPFVWTKQYSDDVQDGNEHYVLPGLRFNFTRQGFFRIDHGFGREPFAGKSFKSDRTRIMGNTQILRWLHIGGEIGSGYATYYDAENPFQGQSRNYRLSLTVQPNSRLNQNVTYNTVRFDRESTGARVFTVHILNLRSTYQFNKHFFIRGIAQFDSSRQRLLTDLLASYELVPGTVVHMGYGSLLEKRGLRDGVLVPGTGDYLATSRGLFFKASYLHRF